MSVEFKASPVEKLIQKKREKKVEGKERENVRSELRYEYFRKVGKYGRLEVEVGHQWPRKIAGRVVGI